MHPGSGKETNKRNKKPRKGAGNWVCKRASKRAGKEPTKNGETGSNDTKLPSGKATSSTSRPRIDLAKAPEST